MYVFIEEICSAVKPTQQQPTQIQVHVYLAFPLKQTNRVIVVVHNEVFCYIFELNCVETSWNVDSGHIQTPNVTK